MANSIGALANLPKALEYLIEPALKYGVHQTDDERMEFLQRATEDEMEELATVAERYRLSEHHDLVANFFDQHPIDKYPESANLYWLFGVMDQAGLALSPENWDTVERHVAALRRFGSYRLASERCNAAMFLAAFGKAAAPAIPDLRRALKDEELRVQVWAHYALAVIEGDRAQHEKAVREIQAQDHIKDEFGMDHVASVADCVLEKFSEM